MPARHTLTALAAIAVSLALTPTSEAQDRRHYMRGEFAPSGIDTYGPGDFSGTIDPATTRLMSAHINVDIAYSMEAWTLMGTPVQACNITWHHRGGQGERLTDEIYLQLPELGASLGLNAEALNVLTADPAIRAYDTPTATGRNVFGLYIQRDVLSSEPRVFNLDFWALAEGRQNTETGNRIPPFYMRCLTGALGTAGGEGFNTPYAFDMDEVFRDLNDARGAAERFRYITQIDGATDPADFENSQHAVLTEIDFDLTSVRNYLHRRLREEAAQARAYANAMQQRLREQEAEAAAAEAQRQAAAATGTDASARSGAITAADRRYSPLPDSAGSLGDIMGRVQTLVEERVAVRVPQARAADPEPPAPASTASIVLPSDPVFPADVDEAMARAEALEASERDLAGIIADAREAAPRDMSRYADSIPDDPLVNIEQHLYYESLFLRRVGDSSAYTRNGCSSPCRSELIYDFNAVLKLSPDVPFEGCEANYMDADDFRRIGIGINGESFGSASYGPARGRVNGQGRWNVRYAQLTFRCGDRERIISVDQIPAQPIPAAQCQQLLNSREIEEELWWYRGGSQQYYDAVYNRAYGYCTDLLGRQ